MIGNQYCKVIQRMVAKELQFAKQIKREGREWREEKYHGRMQRHMRRQGNKQMHRPSSYKSTTNKKEKDILCDQE